MDTSTLTCHFAPVFSKANRRKKPQSPSQPERFPELPLDWVAEFETIPLPSMHLFAHLFRSTGEKLQHKAIVMLHGQGEHSGRYLHLPHYLKDAVGSIYAIDHRGHGQSSGNRGHIRDFDDYAEDAALAIRRYSQYLKNRYGRAEIHLVGHSMGGLIALRTIQLHPDLELASVAVTAPMIDLAFKVPTLKLLAANILYKVLPSLSLPTEALGALVSSDPAVVKHYQADPLNHGLASSAFFITYLKARENLFAAAKTFKHPLLFLLPTGDRIISHQATVNFIEKLKAPEKKVLVYEGLYHEVMNEPEKAQVLSDLQGWIAAHSEK